MNVKDRNVLLCVTGGIAAYKSAELVRLLLKEGATVQVVMTKNAVNFITPLTLKTLTGQPVLTDTFEEGNPGSITHIETAARADLLLIAPATANIIGKLALGIADDLLSTLYLVTRAPVMVAPAMNQNMYTHPAVQKNIETLKSRGVMFVGPAWGELACGDTGPGKMEDPLNILSFINSSKYFYPKAMEGLRVVVTAGPTHEYIDSVRYISNSSSGRMGYAIAKEASRQGGEVTLISGPVALTPPFGVSVTKVTSAQEMREQVLKEGRNADIIIMAAAVGDFTPENYSSRKLKKDELVDIKLRKNPDILMEASEHNIGKFRVGFAAETEDVLKFAQKKLKSKKVDMIVANDVSRTDIGFNSEMNEVSIIDTSGTVLNSGKKTKHEIASFLIENILRRMKDLKLPLGSDE